MAYDEKLAERIRGVLQEQKPVTERKMFGGLAFLLHGKMFCGIVENELMVRVGPERYQTALAEAHVRPMDFTGRSLNGYIFVKAEGVKTEEAVEKWVAQGVTFVTTLAEKNSAPKRARRTKK